MAEYAKIDTGVVVDVALAAAPFGDYTVAVTGGAGIGWGWDGVSFTEPTPTPYNPVGADLVAAKAVLVERLNAKADAVHVAIEGTTLPGKQRALITNLSLVAKYDATTATAFETAIMTAQATALGLSLADWALAIKARYDQQAAAFGQIQAEVDTATAAINVAANYADALAAYDAAHTTLDSGLYSYVEINFSTEQWDTDGGLSLAVTPASGWVFNGPGDVDYDAEDPATPTFSIYVINAKPSHYGDTRITGQVTTVSVLDQGQMQAVRMSQIGHGYIAMCVWVGTAAGNVYVYRANGSLTPIGTDTLPVAASVTGVWLQLTDAGGGDTGVEVFTKDSGVWTSHVTYTDTTPVLEDMIPGVIFNSDSGATLTDPQVYNIAKFEATADGSLT